MELSTMTNTLTSPTLGFQTFRRMDGGSPTAGMTEVWIASTDPGFMFRGDPVITSSAPGANQSGAYVTAVNGTVTASSGFLVRGIFQGCYQYQPSVNRVVWSNSYQGTITGSTGDIKAYVVDDPEELFLVQASTNSAITSSMIGLNISISTGSTTGNTNTGYSNITLQATSIGSTSTLPFRLVDFYSAYAPGGGAFGNVGFNSSVSGGVINGLDNNNPANIVVVRLNNCDRLSLTARST
jgi:hypothetical protein